jgi:transposase InsO family protein
MFKVKGLNKELQRQPVIYTRQQFNTSEPRTFKPILKVGKSKVIRSDNSSKFIVKHLQTWFRQVGIEPIQISKRLPWGNGYHERFNGKLRHEF